MDKFFVDGGGFTRNNMRKMIAVRHDVLDLLVRVVRQQVQFWMFGEHFDHVVSFAPYDDRLVGRFVNLNAEMVIVVVARHHRTVCCPHVTFVVHRWHNIRVMRVRCSGMFRRLALAHRHTFVVAVVATTAMEYPGVLLAGVEENPVNNVFVLTRMSVVQCKLVRPTDSKFVLRTSVLETETLEVQIVQIKVL